MSAFEVLLPSPVNPLIAEEIDRFCAVHRLYDQADPDAFLAAIGGRVRAVVSGGAHRWRVDAGLMERLPKLELVAHFGVGYDQVDAAWAADHGITVTHTPDVLNDEVADLAKWLLATVRQIPQADAYLRAGRWPSRSFPLSASLRGRRLGILGLGRIGRAIAERAQPFGVSIAYHGRTRRPDVPFPYHETVLDLARASDILMVVAPATPETLGIVDAPVLEALGPDGILINVARGSLVDEPALIAALRDKVILGAGLDVFASEPNVPAELIALDHVVLLPHVGSASHVTRAAMAQLVVDNLASWASGRGPLTPVPETPWPRPLDRPLVKERGT